MSRLRRASAVAGPYLAAFAGGVLGSALFAFLGAWLAFQVLVEGDGQDATNAFVVLPFFGIGAVIGFWGGIGLVVFGLYRFRRKRTSDNL
jgi:hypothetical protein